MRVYFELSNPYDCVSCDSWDVRKVDVDSVAATCFALIVVVEIFNRVGNCQTITIHTNKKGVLR